MVMTEAFVVPLKRFDVAKERLRRGGVADVSALAHDLARSVVRHCAPGHVIVLSESRDVTDFALALGVEVLESAATTLNDAVQNAYDQLGERFERLIVVHGDIRDPAGLGEFSPDLGVTIVTDHLVRGTNVLVVPTRRGFQFHYGDGSAVKHQIEAERLGLVWRLITDSPWRFDVDEPGDLTSS
jgi:2-phospho-L-lactate guanylyltransferase (CobY/MobA/RfbA family)